METQRNIIFSVCKTGNAISGYIIRELLNRNREVTLSLCEIGETDTGMLFQPWALYLKKDVEKMQRSHKSDTEGGVPIK